MYVGAASELRQSNHFAGVDNLAVVKAAQHADRFVVVGARLGMVRLAADHAEVLPNGHCRFFVHGDSLRLSSQAALSPRLLSDAVRYD